MKFLTEPYLMLPTTESMDVAWITDTNATRSYVEYGPKDSPGGIVEAVEYRISGLEAPDPEGDHTVPFPAFQQLARVSGLDPGTRYFYRVVSETPYGRVVSDTYSFKTAPVPGTPLRLLILSDLQIMPQGLQTLKLAGRQNVDLIVYNGDFQNDPVRAGGWFGTPGKEAGGQGLDWFGMMQGTEDGCKLLQYVPIFPCPGNHEITRQGTLTDKALAKRDHMDLSIYMQLFRSYYPGQEYGPDGNHWYSMDYGDLHLISLSVFRWAPWPATEAPGWLLFDGIGYGSPQYGWLKADLESKAGMYVMVSQHWHMFNRGEDTQEAYTDPIPSGDPGTVEYPKDKDYLMRDIKPLFEKYGVNAVTFGHSHVYERYVVDGVHYIEAASISNCYRGKDDPYEPHGNRPIIEENRFRSFMVISVDPQGGMSAQGIQASMGKEGVGTIGRVFDEFSIAGGPSGSGN